MKSLLKRASDLDWGDLRYFVVAANSGSMSEAARRLGVSVATVGRRIERLEDDLGVRLFHRHSAGLSLTQEAPELLTHAEAIVGHVTDLFEAARFSEEDQARGVVTVTTFETLATHAIARSIGQLTLKHPGIRVVLRATPRVIKFSDRTADIALRLVRPAEDRVIAQRIATFDFGLYVHPSYLALKGRPESVETLHGFDVITYDDRFDTVPEVAWLHMRTSPENMTLRVSSLGAILAAISAGAGMGVLPHFIAPPELVCLFDCHGLPARPMWLAMHEDLKDIARVRLVFDHLKNTVTDLCQVR